MDRPETNGRLRRGDIVINTYGAPDYNDLHIVIGGTKYVDTLMLFKGKLSKTKSRFYRYHDNLKKIGYFNIDTPIVEAMVKAKSSYQDKE